MQVASAMAAVFISLFLSLFLIFLVHGCPFSRTTQWNGTSAMKMVPSSLERGRLGL
jgi:hypothetical protein